MAWSPGRRPIQDELLRSTIYKPRKSAIDVSCESGRGRAGQQTPSSKWVDELAMGRPMVLGAIGSRLVTFW